MGEGFPLWSLAPMAWEGREPLRDWICLSVSLCFYVLRFCPFTFLIYPKIRNSDWIETFAQIFFQKLAFLWPNKGINCLTRGPRGWGRAHLEWAWAPPSWPPRAPSHVDFLPKNHKYSKIILRPFLSRLDSVWYGVSAKHKTCNKQELALGTGSICLSQK